MRIGEEFAAARERKGWTLRELEKRSGVSNALISQIETGWVNNPTWRTVVSLAKTLGLSLKQLALCDTTKEISDE